MKGDQMCIGAGKTEIACSSICRLDSQLLACVMPSRMKCQCVVKRVVRCHLVRFEIAPLGEVEITGLLLPSEGNHLQAQAIRRNSEFTYQVGEQCGVPCGFAQYC